MEKLAVLTQALRTPDRPDAAAVRDHDIKAASTQFEAIFMRSLMKEMRKVNELFDSKDNPFNSDSVRMMQGFYDDALCDELAKHQGIGIAEMLVKQLSAPHHD